MTGKFAIITLSSVALLACAMTTDSCGCSPPPIYQAHLVGFVSSGNGPLVDARVTAAVFMADCQAASYGPIYAQREATVDAAGHYTFDMQTRRPDTLCARVVAHAAPDSLVRDRVSLITLGDDSVRVDFTFP